MKKLLCILIFALTCFTQTSAQTTIQMIYEIRKAFEFYQNNKSQTEFLDTSLAAEKINGSPYLNDEFIEGNVYTTSKLKFVDVPLRYNIYNEQVEFRNADEQILAIAVPEIIESIEFGNLLMEYIPYQEGKKISKSYFVVLEKGEASLFCRHHIILKEAKEAAAYQDAQPPQFIRKPDTYYIRIGMEAAKPVSKRKDLQNIFAEKGKDINAFIKTNRIKPGNAESLRELVTFYNAL